MKTPLYFAFGKHDTSPESRNFFNDTIGDYVREHILEGDSLATLIQEFLIYDITSYGKDKSKKKMLLNAEDKKKRQHLRNLKTELNRLERKINSDWQKHHGIGEPFMMVSIDWGYMSPILGANTLSNDKIRTLLEPQSEEVAYLDWHMRAQGHEKVNPNDLNQIKDQIEYMKSIQQFQYLRDTGVFRLSEKLRRKNPLRHILIPRGTFHQGMMSLFDPAKYDIRYDAMPFEPNFEDEYISRSFTEHIENDELEYLARLQLHFIKHFLKQTNSFAGRFAKLTGKWREREAQYTREAKEYALSTV